MSSRKSAVVIGLGEFGFHVSKSLSENGCEVTVVDIAEKRVEAAKNYVMEAVVADASQKDSLNQVISPDTDFIIIGIGNIEKSMITTLYLKDYGIEKLYVKAITEEHERILNLIGVKNVIFPERDVTRKLASRLMYNNLVDYLPLSPEYTFAELKPLKRIIGKALKDIDLRKEFDLSVIAVQKAEANRMIFMPRANYNISEDDKLMVLGKCVGISEYNKLLS